MQRTDVFCSVSMALSSKSCACGCQICICLLTSFGYFSLTTLPWHDFHIISGHFGIGQSQAVNCPSTSCEASVVVAGAALALMGRKATAPTVKQLVRAAQ